MSTEGTTGGKHWTITPRTAKQDFQNMQPGDTFEMLPGMYNWEELPDFAAKGLRVLADREFNKAQDTEKKA